MTVLPSDPPQHAGDGTTAEFGFVVAQPLEAAAFVTFGAVVAHDGQPGRTMMDLAFAAQPGTAPRLWVNYLAVSAHPIVAKNFELHPSSAQTFLPLRGGRWLVIVAPSGPDGQPRSDAVQAFVTVPHQGIIYRPGTWHHGLIALDTDAEVAVVMSLTGQDDDTVLAQLPLPVSVDLSRHKD